MHKILLLMIVIGSALFPPISTAGTLESLLEETSQRLISEVHQRDQSYEENPGALFAKVDAIMTNIIDFPLITRAVMGSFYRGSSAAQRVAFEKTFRSTMVELLTKSLVLIEGESIRVLPLKKKPDRKASVAMEVDNKEGTTYKLVYSMGKVDDLWKIRNIIVDGVNLGLIYRNQFKAAMNERKNDIDAVIRHWQLPNQTE